MQESANHAMLYSERIVRWAKDKLTKFKLPFISTMLIGLLSHAYMFTNKLPNHDDVFYFFSKGASLSSSRWGLDVLASIIPNYSMPWYHGILSILLISIAVCVIIDLFQIKNSLYQGLFAGLVISFPTLIAIFAYMFTSSSYAVAFLCSVVAPWLFVRKGWIAKVFALFILAFAISIYQAYLALAASILLLFVLQQVLQKPSNVKQAFLNGLSYVVFLLTALGIYYLVLSLALHFKSAELGAYAAGNLSPNGTLLDRILLTYEYFFDEVLHRRFAIVPIYAERPFYIIGILFCGIEFLLWAIKTRKVMPIVLAAGLIALLPMSINAVVLVSAYVHSLMVYSFISVFLLAIILMECNHPAGQIALEKHVHFVARESIVISLSIIMLNNVFIANQRYLEMSTSYAVTHSYYTRLLADIQMTPGFDEDTEVAFLGFPSKMGYNGNEFYKEMSGNLVSTGGIYPRMYSEKEFLNYYLGVDVNFVSDEHANQLRSMDMVKQMPCYPFYGSIQKIDGVVVVKLSD